MTEDRKRHTRRSRRNHDDELPDAMPEDREIPEGPGEEK